MSQRIGRWYLPALGGFAVLLVALLALLAVDRAMRVSALSEAEAAAAADGAILAAGLESELDKFTLVPRVLAADPDVQLLLRGERRQREVLNRRFADLAEQTGAAAIYLMDADGETLAASNWRLPSSFVGSNYGFRSYFAQARLNGTATEFALGTVSRRPGLYIAQRVGEAENPLGVVAVKVEFNAIEQSWRDAEQGAFVTDGDGVVLIASNPDWRFRTTLPGEASARDKARDELRFGTSDLETMPDLQTGSTLAVDTLIEWTEPVSDQGWELHLMADPSPRVEAALANGRLLVLLGFVLVMCAGAVLLLWVRRREARTEAAMAEQSATLRDQLQQANRLATLGQVTAGVGHEIRQPVAAMRVFAESGEKLIAAGDAEAARANFARIAALTVKIGKITEELHGFGRRAIHPPKRMPLSQVIDGALLLLKDRFKREDVTLEWRGRELAETPVRGEHVRLEQVLINLLQNALDATPGGGRIVVEVAVESSQCRLSVTDNGPGIDPDVAETLFHPFTTTKPTGLGLGLAISLDIMRALSGDLLCEPSPVGARFTMVIPRA